MDDMVVVCCDVCCCCSHANCGDLLSLRKGMVMCRWCWPNGGRWYDVVFVVDCVVMDVVCAVICDGCDGENQGEVFVMLV